MNVVFVSGVNLGRRALQGLLVSGEFDASRANLTAVFSLSAEKEAQTVGFVPFDDLAKDYGFPLHKVRKLNSAGGLGLLRAAEPDLIFVIGWSELVNSIILDLPAGRLGLAERHGPGHGCIGMHPTMLPIGRGRAPLPWTIIKGFERSGVSMFYLEEGADTGDIIAQREYDIEPEDDVASVYEKVAQLHHAICKETFPLLVAGKAARVPQDSLAKMRGVQPSYWEKRTPEDGRIQWNLPARDVMNWIRALTRPYPGAFTEWRGRRLSVWKATRVDDAPGRFAPGQVLGVDSEGLVVACAAGRVCLVEVQPVGEEAMTGVEFALCNRIEIGAQFGG
jgi:methionyl-tRNA formyltransferase